MSQIYINREAVEQLKRAAFLKPSPLIWLFEGKRTTHYTGRLTYYYDEGEDTLKAKTLLRCSV